MTTPAVSPEGSSTEQSPGLGSPEENSPEARPDVRAPRGDGPPERHVPEQQEVSATTESAPLEAVAALPQVLKIVGAVVAPTTLLTALLFYFGRLHITGLFRYLGVNFTVLDLTAQDYLIRSADGLFVPLTVVAAVALLAIWVHRLLLGIRSAETRPIVLRVLAALAAITGLVLISVAMAAIVGDVALLTAHPETGGLSLSIGVLLLAYAARLLRLLMAEQRPERVQWRTPEAVIVAEWGAIFVLVSVGLFWAVGSYAIGVGTGRAQQIEIELPNSPDVVLYSEKSLSLQAPGVQEVTCRKPRRGLPVPLRRTQARAAVREPVSLPPRKLDTRERRSPTDPPQRSAAAGVQRSRPSASCYLLTVSPAPHVMISSVCRYSSSTVTSSPSG